MHGIGHRAKGETNRPEARLHPAARGRVPDPRDPVVVCAWCDLDIGTDVRFRGFRSLSRKFVGANGEEYRWIHRAVKDHEWSVRGLPYLRCRIGADRYCPQCVDSRDYVVAHYTLKPPEKPAYSTSGNMLTIYEPFTHLSIGTSACMWQSGRAQR